METKLTWAQTTGMPAKAPEKSQYSYSKEVLLSYFSTPLPIPTALQEVPFVCSVETLVPMANLPLSEVEKRLISSANINADTKQRQHHDKNRKPANRKEVKSFPEEEILSPNGTSQELWDMPMGIGGFGSDGVFQDASRKLSEGGKLEKDATMNHDEILDNHSMQNSFSTKVFHNNIPQDLTEPKQRIGQVELTNQKNTQEVALGLHDPRADMYSRGTPLLPRIPPFTFTPQSWMYRDPSGILQGPFSSQQMQDWYSEGFFPPDLPIKHVEDPGFISIAALISRFGSKVPFLAELEESHTMSRLLYERRVAAMVMSSQQQDQARFGMVQTGNNHSAVSNGIKPDHTVPSWGMPSLGAVRPTWEDSRHNNPVVSAVAPPQRPIAPESNLASTIGSRPEVDVYAKKQPLPLEEKMEALQVSPVSHSTPSAKNSKAAVDPMALPPKPKPLSPVTAEKKRSEPPIKSEEVSPIKASTTMAPWAKAGGMASGQAPAEKMKMKEIQDKEEIRRFQLEQERQKKADEHVLAQASAIMKAEALNASISKPEGHVWGSNVSKPAALKFSEIMVEENIQKNNTDFQGKPNVVIGGAKRYADLVNSPAAGNITKVSRPLTGPASNQIKNVVASRGVISSGWQTVGKGGQVVHPPSETRPVAPVVTSPTASATPHSGIVLPVKPSAAFVPVKTAPKPKIQAAPALTNWFYSALKSIPPSSGVNVNDFFLILQSISVNDKTFITNICDDTLGGIPSIDTRKFGEEYLRCRLLEEKTSNSSIGKDESSFTVVTKKKKKSSGRE